MPIPTASYASIHDDYLAAIEWMHSLNVFESQAGRVRHYEKILRYWKDAYRTASDGEVREALPNFVSSVFEIFDFIRIHKAFKNEPPKRLQFIVEKLKKGVNGPNNAFDETPDSTKARNFLFEASVAARAHNPNRDVEAILDARSDTGIKIEGKKIWVECKRVASGGQLEKNIRKACNQLKTRLEASVGSGHRGIVAVDITKILNHEENLFISKNDDELDASTRERLDDFVYKHADQLKHIYATQHRKIIGTLFCLKVMAKSEARNLLVHSAQWALIPSAGASSEDVRVQEQLVASILAAA